MHDKWQMSQRSFLMLIQTPGFRMLNMQIAAPAVEDEGQVSRNSLQRKKSAGPSTTATWKSLVNWSRKIVYYSQSTTAGGCLLNAIFRCSKRKLRERGANRGLGVWSGNTTCRVNFGKNSTRAASIRRIS